MKIEYTGRNLDVPSAVKALVTRKLLKLQKVLGSITHVRVTLGADKHRRKAEVLIASPHLSLQADEEGADLDAALTRVLDKLTRQAQRRIGKLQSRRRKTVRPTAAWSGVFEGAPAQDRPRVVSTKRLTVRPMTVADAAARVAGSDEELVVFRDSQTERVSVVYKRKDGGLGLLEPEV